VKFENIDLAKATVATADPFLETIDATSCGSPRGCFLAHIPLTPGEDVAQNWTAYFLPRFQGSPKIETVPQPDVLKSITDQLDTILASNQDGIYQAVNQDFQKAGTEVQKSAQLLSEGNLLFQAYTNFGLSISLQTDSKLHAALYGTQAIYDGEQAANDFAASISQPVTATETSDNKISDLLQSINSRMSSLKTAIDAALSRIQQTHLAESLPQVDETIQDLQAFRNLQNAGALSACTYQLLDSDTRRPLDIAWPASSGGKATIVVQQALTTEKPLNGCVWRASSHSPWIKVSSKAQTGNGTVSYSVATNKTGSLRRAVLVVGDQEVNLIQAGVTN